MTPLEQLSMCLADVEVVDLAPLLYSNMPHWPSHPDLSIIGDARNYAQHGYFSQTIVLPEHSGCHVDAPPHVHADMADQTIDTFPPDCLIAPGKKVDATEAEREPGSVLTLGDFNVLAQAQQVAVESGDVVLVEFGWDRHLDASEAQRPELQNWWGANEPGLAEDLCRFLADRRVRAVGTDTVACDIAEKDGRIISAYGHETYFLPNRILIVEGLYGLSRIPNEFYFFAMPLKIKGGSGSPIRPVALVPRGERL